MRGDGFGDMGLRGGKADAFKDGAISRFSEQPDSFLNGETTLPGGGVGHHGSRG